MVEFLSLTLTIIYCYEIPILSSCPRHSQKVDFAFFDFGKTILPFVTCCAMEYSTRQFYLKSTNSIKFKKYTENKIYYCYFLRVLVPLFYWLVLFSCFYLLLPFTTIDKIVFMKSTNLIIIVNCLEYIVFKNYSNTW